MNVAIFIDSLVGTSSEYFYDIEGRYKIRLIDGATILLRKVDNGFARIRNAGFLIPKFDRSSVFGAFRNPGLRPSRISGEFHTH